MSKHTPGPWFIGRGEFDQSRHIYAEQMVRDDDGEEWHPVIACTDDDETMIDWEANARLIAAAPDMYDDHKWNKNVRDIVDDMLDAAGYAENSNIRKILSMMHFDAIAKAEGQS